MQTSIKKFWNHEAVQLLNETVLKAKITKKNSYYNLGFRLQAIHPEGPNLRINFLEVSHIDNSRVCSSCIFSQIAIEPTHLGRQLSNRMCRHGDYCKQLIEEKFVHLIGTPGKIFVTYVKDIDYGAERRLFISRKPNLAKNII